MKIRFPSDFMCDIMGGALVTVVLLGAVAVAYHMGDPPSAMAQVTSDQDTDKEGAPGWCVDHTIVDKLIAGYDSLDAMAVTFEATDEHWFQMWIEAQAEIERLNEVNTNLKEANEINLVMFGSMLGSKFPGYPSGYCPCQSDSGCVCD